jgi:hypothetical protein
MFIVHKGYGFKVPEPIREQVAYVNMRERLFDELHRNEPILNAGYTDIPVDEFVECILTNVGGRVE